MSSSRLCLGSWVVRGALGALCTFASVAPADAREESGGESSGSADDLIDEGIRLRRAGDDVRALEVFRRAEKLDPDSARVLVHLAANHQALGEWAAADEYLARALKLSEDPYVARHQSTLAAARRAIDAHMGTLQVSGEPLGAELRLNGRVVGRLPLERPVRVEAGIYTLEAAYPGYFPVTRSVALAGGVLVREAVELSPRDAGGEVSFQPEDRVSRSTPWLTWTFLGLGAAATAGAVYAWSERERHVEVWNDESKCLAIGFTREELCGDSRRAGERAENWMWVGAATAGALFSAGVVTYLLRPADSNAEHADLACGMGLTSVTCSGRF